MIEPNWHVAIVHFPIALLVMGFFAEVVALLTRGESLRVGARWMMVLGAVASVPVSVSGLYALQDLARRVSEEPGSGWAEMAQASKLTAAQWGALVLHAKVQIVSSLLGLGTVAIFVGVSDVTRRVLYLPGMAIIGAAVGLTMFGAHIGGQSVYVQGSGVRVAKTEASTEQAAHSAATEPAVAGKMEERAKDPAGATTRGAATQGANQKFDLTKVVPPLEAHGVLAGSGIALGVMALACAYRNTHTARAAPAPRTQILVGSRGVPPKPPAYLPASRLLVLAAIVTACASGTGVWYLSHAMETTKAADLWEAVMTFPPKEVLKPEHQDSLRRPVHVALGSLLVGIPLLLALWVRVRPHGRFVLTFLIPLYVMAGLGQAVVGTLLLYDNPVGPLTHFAGEEGTTAPVTPTVSPTTGATTEGTEGSTTR